MFKHKLQGFYPWLNEAPSIYFLLTSHTVSDMHKGPTLLSALQAPKMAVQPFSLASLHFFRGSYALTAVSVLFLISGLTSMS